MKRRAVARRAILATALALMAMGSTNEVRASDKSRVHIEVVSAERGQREITYSTQGSPGLSTTNCTGSATATASGSTVTADGNSTCNTTSTAPLPSRTVRANIGQTQVRAIMPDGRHVMLGCQDTGNGSFNWAGAISGNPAAHFGRGCPNLEPGVFETTIDGNNVTVYFRDLGGKEHKAKFLYFGNWKE